MMLSLHTVSVLFIIIKHNWMCAVDWLFQFSVHSNNAKWLDEITVERVVSRFHPSTVPIHPRPIWIMVDYLMPIREHTCTFTEWRIAWLKNYLVSVSVSSHRGLRSRNTSEVETEGEEGLHKLPSSMQSKTFAEWRIVRLKNTENYLVSVSAYRGLKSINISEVGIEGVGLPNCPPQCRVRHAILWNCKPLPSVGKVVAFIMCVSVCLLPL